MLYADIGDHDLTTTNEATNQVIKCDRVIQHARYNNETQDNDVALCHLETPLTFSRTVKWYFMYKHFKSTFKSKKN